MRLTCTPEPLDELVVGRLLTEGLVASIDDIVSLYICEQGLRARVFLKKGTGVQFHVRKETDVSTCCTDNHIILQRDAQTLPVLQPIAWNKMQIQRLAACIRGNAPLYERTRYTAAFSVARTKSFVVGRTSGGTTRSIRPLAGRVSRESILQNTSCSHRGACRSTW